MSEIPVAFLVRIPSKKQRAEREKRERRKKGEKVKRRSKQQSREPSAAVHSARGQSRPGSDTAGAPSPRFLEENRVKPRDAEGRTGPGGHALCPPPAPRPTTGRAHISRRHFFNPDSATCRLWDPRLVVYISVILSLKEGQRFRPRGIGRLACVSERQQGRDPGRDSKYTPVSTAHPPTSPGDQGEARSSQGSRCGEE